MGAFRSDPSILQILSEINDKVLKADTDNTYTYSPLEHALADDRLRFVNHAVLGLASGGTTNLYFENPQNSGVTVKAIVVVHTTDQGVMRTYYNPTVSTASATTVPVMCPYVSHTPSTPVKVYTSASLSSGSATIVDVIPGGSGRRAIGSTTAGLPGFVLQEGDSILIEVENTSSNSNDVSITVIWVEE